MSSQVDLYNYNIIFFIMSSSNQSTLQTLMNIVETANRISKSKKKNQKQVIPPKFLKIIQKQNESTKKSHICSLNNYSVSGEDFWRLNEGNLLSDNDIEIFFHVMLPESVDISNCFIYSTTTFVLMNREKDFERTVYLHGSEKLFQKQFVFFPMNVCGIHWTLLVVCNPGSEENRCIVYYDPLNAPAPRKVISLIGRFMQERYYHETKSKERITFRTRDVGEPTQTNSIDCGLFIMLFAENILTKSMCDMMTTDFSQLFEQSDVPLLRLRIKDRLKRCIQCDKFYL